MRNPASMPGHESDRFAAVPRRNRGSHFAATRSQRAQPRPIRYEFVSKSCHNWSSRLVRHSVDTDLGSTPRSESRESSRQPRQDRHTSMSRKLSLLGQSADYRRRKSFLGSRRGFLRISGNGAAWSLIPCQFDCAFCFAASATRYKTNADSKIDRLSRRPESTWFPTYDPDDLRRGTGSCATSSEVHSLKVRGTPSREDEIVQSGSVAPGHPAASRIYAAEAVGFTIPRLSSGKKQRAGRVR